MLSKDGLSVLEYEVVVCGYMVGLAKHYNDTWETAHQDHTTCPKSHLFHLDSFLLSKMIWASKSTKTAEAALGRGGPLSPAVEKPVAWWKPAGEDGWDADLSDPLRKRKIQGEHATSKTHDERLAPAA